ncbi:uncharacterized protein LOC118179433 [Stegodyphus dumicola]|uniref:uncharacterized protein LOC118179433 n=1 Tax=Stegodyphus dumicola TaxID=202533 RepID=UPI0015B23072|nr:uncharacterized protein LOC118179433 [Stegodyphus dumicola]
MFPDSVIARNVSFSERKFAYLCHFGLKPYFQSLIYDELKNISHLLFDETLNKRNKKEQLDLHIRYCQSDQNQVVTQFLTCFHGTLSDVEELSNKIYYYFPSLRAELYNWKGTILLNFCSFSEPNLTSLKKNFVTNIWIFGSFGWVIKYEI